jgi:hypothetical protein
MRKILTADERREFYKRVTESLMERMKSSPLQEDVDVADDDDYDGGRYDFYTTRGVK